jgi:cytochrome c oxidase cbb3-type subunit 2
MGQNLGHVPAVFVAAAGAVILLPLFAGPIQTRLRELGVTAALFLIALVAYRSDGPIQAAASLSQIERGRQVYISEGCISCHSQYVRPNTRDVLMWGPIESMDEVHRQRPPLIGNRRQGPDLSQVGGRRSPLWLKIHFFNPEEVSGASIMPSYGFLFADGRGDDLVAYLESLRGAGTVQQIADQQQWHLAAAEIGDAKADRGQRLFARFCATCHSNRGATRMAWLANFEIAPEGLTNTPLKNIPVNASGSTRIDRIAQIAKFGIPGTDMPGHEYLSDTDIASISLWLAQNAAQPVITMNPKFHTGDNP